MVKISVAFLTLISYSSLAHAQVSPAESQDERTEVAAPRAGSEIIYFNVSGGPLTRVLKKIADQARASIATDGVTAQTISPGVTGRMTLRQALEQATSGTGWSIVELQSGAIRLTRSSDDGAQAGDIVVSGRRTDFVKTDSSLLTRTGTPLRQTPGTIDSVTAEVISSQNLLNVGEALRNIPGALIRSNSTTQVSVGGDTNGGVTFTNGLRNSSLTNNAPITGLESVEVLKGVASILTGTQVSGGTVNYIPKRANGSKIAIMSVGGGTGSNFFGTFDAGDTLDRSLGLNYRMTGLVDRAANRPNGTNDPHSYSFNGMLGLRRDGLDADIAVEIFNTRNAFADYYNFDQSTRRFLPYGDLLSRDSHNTTESKKVNWSLNKSLINSGESSLTFRTNGLYQEAEGEMVYQAPTALDYFGMGTVSRNTYASRREKQVSLYADLYAKFKTGPAEHNLIVAADLSDNSNIDKTADAFLTFYSTPQPLLGSNALTDPGFIGLLGNTTIDQNQKGIVVQDQINLGPFHFLLGVRKSWYVGDYLRNGVPISTKISNFLPSGGIVFDVSKYLSVYGSYREGFTPVSPYMQRTVDGSILSPTLVHNWEVGFKAGLLRNKLTVNGSYNRYSTTDDVIPDALNPGFYVGGPGAKGYVAEISVAGSVTPTLKVLAGYVHQKNERNDGLPSYSIPSDVANFWAIKTFKLGPKRSLDVGFGGNYNSGALAISTLGLPDVVLDHSLAFRASAGLTLEKTKVNLVVENIFDRQNFEPGYTQEAVIISPPRVIRLVVSQTF